MNPDVLSSASGLRPLSGFVVIGLVVSAVLCKVSYLSFAGESRQTTGVRTDTGRCDGYEIEDRQGRPLAQFVRRVDLVMSPRSMWQGHTPRRMAEQLSAAMEGFLSPDELLQRFLPDAVNGVIEVESWDLTGTQAVRIADWILRGRGEDAPSLEGLQVVRHPELRAHYRLLWQPEALLSQDTRDAQGVAGPITWTRWIADELARCLYGEAAIGRRGDVDLLAKQRRNIWRALVPRASHRCLEGVPAGYALAVQRTLELEGVGTHQMRLELERERIYPSGHFPLLGDWGFAAPEQTEPMPRSGLELLCSRTLADETFAHLPRRSAAYSWRELRSVHQPVRPYYVDAHEATAEPTVRTTLDVELQRELRRHLQQTVEDQEAVLAMGIVVEVESGAVRALDVVSPFELEGFAPALYQFTPGSTFKVLTMASALEAGVVMPTDEFDVGFGGEYRIDDTHRVIHEAEGHAEGVITARECLAYSMNAGLVQIGLRLEPAYLRGKLEALGYDQRPELGVGPERPGYIPPLKKGTWSREYTHASVCFGHEVMTTLTQHAAGLASIARDGLWRPLTLISGVRQEDEHCAPKAPSERRVFRPEVARTVREMMEFAAVEGTGKKVYREGLNLATKTGTTEKVPTEMCAHVYHRALEAARESGVVLSGPQRDALKAVRPDDHRSCYTSSMCILGSLPGEPELLVLVVVEEPRSSKFGSDVAGPAAIGILEEALGLTRRGARPVLNLVDGFAESGSDVTNTHLDAWRVESWSDAVGVNGGEF